MSIVGPRPAGGHPRVDDRRQAEYLPLRSGGGLPTPSAGRTQQGLAMTRPAVSLLVLAWATAPVAAQPGRQVGQVVGPAVVARSGPGDRMPDTGPVPAGTPVVVVGMQGDWVEIEPPAGAVSWMRYVQLFDPDAPSGPTAGGVWDAVVNPDGAAPVEVAVGRPGLNRPLDVRRITVPAGTVVRVTGPFVEYDGVKWYPVVPPAGDVRYLPKSAVELRPGGGTKFVVQSPANPADGAATTTPPPTDPAPKAADGDAPTGHPLWAQAEKAEAAGDYAKAETSYLDLARDLNQTGRPKAAEACYARVHAVRERQRAGPKPTAEAGAGPVAARLWGPGQLRLAGLRLEGRPTYALIGPQGKTACYVVAGTGVDLDKFRDSAVQIYGDLTYPGNLNGVGLLRADGVQAARK